ncbi:MAG: aminodeoxychorismate synthase component I [Bacteroidales bacterium]|jgi:para-aminobenzoate synthetase component 1
MLLGKSFIDELNRYGTNREPFLFIIDFEEIYPLVYPLSAVPKTLRFTLPGYPDPINSNVVGSVFRLNSQPVSYLGYLTAFEQVLHHLRQGDSYLVNLTFPTPIKTDLSLEEIYELSEAPYKLLMENQFVVFSPEPFIRINGGMISSYPMKGTIDASLPEAEKRVLEDRKESAEHTTIVDLIRNDLSKVADCVQVKRYRYIDHIRTLDKEILQVSSEIRGLLPDGFFRHLGNILDALLPAGSISGAPKKRTLEIIREAESGPRGYYTGIFGVFDGQNLDSAVMIRFIEQTESGMQYRSGGGITHLSDPVAEYQEMVQKVYLQITKNK